MTASFTWNDLGVDGDLQSAALGQPMAFAAPAGSTEFQAVDLGLDGLGGFGLSLHADDEGFLLVSPSVLSENEEATVLSSSDGRSWSAPADLPGGLDSIRSAGRVGNTFVVLGQSAQDGAMVVTDNGSGWQAVSVADLLGTEDDGTRVGLSMATIEAQGAIAAVSTHREGAEGVDHLLLTTSDAVTWSAQSVSELVDEPVSTIGQPVISGAQVVVPVAPIRPRGPNGHLEQVALVATLP
ncbi:MAG TPA: hypothetical protein VGV93_04215 [Acidimicrobiales bacterium]|nr:hypothetical protein [Acidimicrobiales bacterium]